MFALSNVAQIEVDPCPQCQPVGRQAAEGGRRLTVSSGGRQTHAAIMPLPGGSCVIVSKLLNLSESW